MSLTRKLLESLGLDSDKVSTIIEAHVETTDALKNQIEKLKADADALPKVTKDLADAKAELEGIKASGGDWQKKYEKEHADFESYKADLQAKEDLATKRSAYKALLKDAGVSETALDKIVKLAEVKDLELVDGKFKDAENLTKGIQEEWKEFIVKKSVQGARTQTPPGNDNNATTKEDIMKIKDAAIRQKAIQEHPELFGR